MKWVPCLCFLAHLLGLTLLANSSVFQIPANFSVIKKNLRRPAAVHVSPVCGDGRCTCEGRNANCSRRNLDFVPRLPPNITTLDLSFNQLTIKRKDFFDNATNVTYVIMKSVRLADFDSDAFKPFNNLLTLDLSNNQLRHADLTPIVSIRTLRTLIMESSALNSLSGLEFNTPNLQVLVLGGNYFHTQNFTQFAPLVKLKELDVSFNQAALEILTDSMQSLLRLILNDSGLSRGFLKTCRDGVSLFPKLQELHAQENGITFLPKICLPNLVHLNLQNNKLKHSCAASHICNNFCFGEVDGSSTLQTVLLSGNVLYELKWLKDCTNLTHLIAGRNDLGKYFSWYGREEDTFLSKLTNLRTLNLNENRIRSVYAYFFRNLASLIAIDLSKNLLTILPDGVFDGLPNLASISLKDNAITIVRQTTFSASMLNNLKHFDITENPFHCSCDLRWFQRWYTNRGASFLYDVRDVDGLPIWYSDNIAITTADPTDVKCKNLPETAVMDYYVADQACLLSREASIFIIITVSLLFSLMTLCSWLYRYRWHIRLALFEAFPGRQDRLQRLQNQNFQFDVFVSYASEDLDWMRAHLMPQLEEGMGVRLCVHERDFIPGKNIVDNISDCVDESKKLMMIFSPHFARSPWCQFELAFCLTHVLEQGDALLVVLLRDVEARDLTPAMMAVMKTMTYIEWEDENDARDSFWRRILIALREILPGV